MIHFCSVSLDKSTCLEARNHNQLIEISIPKKGINILYHLWLLQNDFVNRVFQAPFWVFVFTMWHQHCIWFKWCESSFICDAGFTGMFCLIKWSLISSFFSYWDDINYCGLFMCLPNPSGDKYWTLFNETQLKTLPTQLAISCNFNKTIKSCWRIAVFMTKQ